MLKRISTIKNVGSYRDCNASAVQFDKISLIYGRNTYGKSTLGDIFSSLQANESAALISRKSIPDDTNPQRIEIQFDNPTGGRELKSVFNGSAWTNPLPSDYTLCVYDDGFYHQNVFLGRDLTRETRENFSDFILGSQGVEKAQLIEDKNKEKGDKNKLKRQLEYGALAGVEDINSFVALPVVEDIADAKELLENTQSELITLQRQQKESESIRSRKTIFPLRMNSSVVDSTKALNSILELGLENPHEKAKEALKQHVDENFARPDGAEQWIKQGLAFLKADNCSLCGQTLSDGANELLDLYKQCFDDLYARHENHIRSVADRHQSELSFSSIWIEEFEASIEKAEIIFDTYPELKENTEYQENLDQLRKLHASLLELKIKLIAISEETIKSIDESLVIKLAVPDRRLPPIITDELEACFSEFDALISEINKRYTIFNRHANDFKKRFQDDQIREDLTRLSNEKDRIYLQVLRYEKREACEQYSSLKTELFELEEEIPRLKSDLENQQQQYLSSYFVSINSYFKELGSRDFELVHRTERRGHRPVNSFTVKFKGHVIADNDLDKVFSESDRRTLGLSVFLASIDALDPEVLAKTIVIMDDPVTSFDDHRIGQTHSKLVQLANRCKQVILLSHFKDGIANFLKVHGFSRSDISLIEIHKSATGSVLKAGEKNEFIKTAHILNTEELIDFVERKIDALRCKPRVYLEEVLNIRFSKQIRDKEVSNENLSSRINELRDKNVVTEEIATKLDSWRQELNPEHHIWVGDDIENQRTTISNFLDFIFHDLVPEPMEGH